MSEVDLQPIYITRRSAIVEPERVVPTTLYFIQRWLPRLGVERWALIQVLRGLCLGAPSRPDGTKRVAVSWRTLSDMLGVHEETIARWLQHEPIPDDRPWRRLSAKDEQSKGLALFIPRLRYSYTSSGGKTRRTGFILEILMEDPLTPEDAERLEPYRQDDTSLNQSLPNGQAQASPLKRQGDALRETVNTSFADLQPVNRQKLGLHTHHMKQQNNDLQLAVNPQKTDSQVNVAQDFMGSLPGKSGKCGKNVITIYIESLNKNIKSRVQLRDALKPIIQCAEQLLDDYHSTAMFGKVLRKLYPDNLSLFPEAVEAALDAYAVNNNTNKGAVFVAVLRSLAEDANIDLGLRFTDTKADARAESTDGFGNLGTRVPKKNETPEDVVWGEVQNLLERQMTRSAFDSFIRDVSVVKYGGGVFVLGVHDMLAKDWLEHRLCDTVRYAIENVLGKPVDVEFSLVAETESDESS